VLVQNTLLSEPVLGVAVVSDTQLVPFHRAASVPPTATHDAVDGHEML
jgi:hypothetical protein